MKGISAVIITLNEERNIARCLQSLEGVADEMIVVDSCSTDRTVALAKELGASVTGQPWLGYAAQKNFANQLAKFDYILSLDADEALSERLRQSLLGRKRSGLEGVYSLNRLTNYCGRWVRHCGWYPDRKTRLFPKTLARWEGDFVHEEIVFAGEPPWSHLTGDLLHYSYYTVAEHYARVERYAALAAEKMKAKGRTGSDLKGALNACARFLRMYFLQLGFLDGRTGWTVCRISAYATWLRYHKLAQLQAT